MKMVQNAFRNATLAVCLAGLGLTAPAMAQEKINDHAVFDLVIKGITAGTLSFSATQDGKGYAVTGKLQSAGLVGMVKKVRYDAKSRGATSKGRYTPSSYAEKADTGKRKSESVMEYRKGVPQVKVYNPPREATPQDVDPATMGGTVDPLTALYATLRDVDKGQECTTSVKMFDGKRASQLSLAKPVAQGEAVTCTGEYRRLKGFTDAEMAEKQRFPFTLIYAPTDNGKMRVVEVVMDSLYGKAKLTRR